MKHLVLVLGAPNDENGILSRMALDRVECAFGIYTCNDDVHFLCTGGFGERFNTTRYPHAHYSKQFLMGKGVKENDFLEFALSSNTVEDFMLSKSIIEREHPDLLMVVTSDYHMRRVRILHDLILNYPCVVFIPAKSRLTTKELGPLVLHEEQAIQQLRDRDYVLY